MAAPFSFRVKKARIFFFFLAYDFGGCGDETLAERSEGCCTVYCSSLPRTHNAVYCFWSSGVESS